MRINAISKIILYLYDDNVVVIEMLLLKLPLFVENYFAMRYCFVVQSSRIARLTLEREWQKVKKFIKCSKIKMD